jgi:hypothetical protein
MLLRLIRRRLLLERIALGAVRWAIALHLRKHKGAVSGSSLHQLTAGPDQVSGADLSVLHAGKGVPDCGEVPGPSSQGRGHADYASAEADTRGPAHTL